MNPYYQDDQARLCECGCGAPVLRRFVSGHNRRGEITTAERRAKIGAAQRRAWTTKRTRKPIGSTRLDSNGYVLVKVGHGNQRWHKQHVLLIEEAIGRQLVPGEQVHHLNCIKTDNRLENLVLCSSPSDHQEIHGSLNGLLGDLMASGAVVFDRTDRRYRLG